MPRTKSDPLLAALIKKLPAPGNEWPVDQQLAWLHLIAMALGAVYGGDAAARLGSAQVKPVFMPVQPKPRHPVGDFISMTMVASATVPASACCPRT